MQRSHARSIASVMKDLAALAKTKSALNGHIREMQEANKLAEEEGEEPDVEMMQGLLGQLEGVKKREIELGDELQQAQEHAQESFVSCSATRITLTASRLEQTLFLTPRVSLSRLSVVCS